MKRDILSAIGKLLTIGGDFGISNGGVTRFNAVIHDFWCANLVGNLLLKIYCLSFCVFLCSFMLHFVCFLTLCLDCFDCADFSLNIDQMESVVGMACIDIFFILDHCLRTIVHHYHDHSNMSSSVNPHVIAVWKAFI